MTDESEAPRPADLGRVSSSGSSGANVQITVPADLGRVSASGSSSASAQITVQRQVLTSARTLLTDGHYAASVVMAQAASEVFIEGSIEELFQLRTHGSLWNEVGEFIASFNIANNERLRRLYTALSGDEIAQEPFWPKLKAHVALRNKIVHADGDATRADAEASYAAVDALMNHVNGVITKARAK